MTHCLYTYTLLFSNCEEERREIKRTIAKISVAIVPYSNNTVIAPQVQL